MTPTPAERAKQLAEDHWQYVEATLKIHGCYEEELKKAAHHYLTAAEHFYLHAVEDVNAGLFRKRIGEPLTPQETPTYLSRLEHGKERWNADLEKSYRNAMGGLSGLQ